MMINVNSEQEKYLRNFLSNFDELIANDDIQLFLDAIDDKIVDNMLANSDNEPDETGIKLQKIYDQIYNQN